MKPTAQNEIFKLIHPAKFHEDLRENLNMFAFSFIFESD